MSAVDDLFRRLRAEKRKALIPFITAGDPDLAFTAALLKELAARGASLCELGVPYSDPIADGPVIQASYTRALNSGVKLQGILETAAAVTPTLPCPVVTMLSYAIIHRHGPQKYVDEAKRAGIAGAIVPDLLVEESAGFAEICRKADFSLIQLVTPTTPRDRAKRIAERTSGFLYYVSVTGITGERSALPPDLLENVAWMRTQTELPICIGFGISSPDQVKLLAPAADGIIVGSAIVRKMEAAAKNPFDVAIRDQTVKDVGAFAAELAAALG
jgi:tryptophan synthase alpha chain